MSSPTKRSVAIFLKDKKPRSFRRRGMHDLKYLKLTGFALVALNLVQLKEGSYHTRRITKGNRMFTAYA